MKISAELLSLKAAGGAFRIAHDAVTTFQATIVSIEHGGQTGIGEAKLSTAWGGETGEAVLANVAAAESLLGEDPFLIEDIVTRLERQFPQSYATVCAVEMALHDLVGKLLGVPLYKFFGLNPAMAPATSFTIGIDEPQAMAAKAREYSKRFAVLKIKLGSGRDEDIVAAIRTATDLPLRLDANTGWDKHQAVETINRLEKYRIEFVEQPVPPGDNDALKFVRARVGVPIMADESSIKLRDLPALVGCVDAVNVKLMKCGGLRRAVEMIHFAHSAGLKVMLGCFCETSLAVTAAAHLSPLVEYADLDGNYLIADDPYEGVGLREGKLVLPDRPGIGVQRRPAKG